MICFFFLIVMFRSHEENRQINTDHLKMAFHNTVKGVRQMLYFDPLSQDSPFNLHHPCYPPDHTLA